MHLRLVDWLVEAETVSDLTIGRIAQDHFSAADHDRDISDGDLKSIQHLLNTDITIEIDTRVRMAVACKKFLNAKGFLRVFGSDQHDVADAAGDQPRPPQEKRAHEDLAQIGVCLDELQQLLVIDLDDLACFAGADGKDCSPT